MDRKSFAALAASLAREAVFALLADHGAPLDDPELLDWAVDGGGGRVPPSPVIVARVLAARPPDRSGATRALRFACVAPGAEVVPMLVAAGADPNGADPEHGGTPLSLAAEHGRLEVVAALLAAGADPGKRVPREHDGRLETAAEITARHGHVAVAALLMAAR